MPNFAQEFPFLLFLPFVVIVAVAMGVGAVNLGIMLTTRAKSRPVVVAALPKTAIIPSPMQPAFVLAAVSAIEGAATIKPAASNLILVAENA